MRLRGLGRASSKPAGGIVSVGLIAVPDFKSAVYDPAGDCFTSAETSEPFAAYVFREDRASYTEEAFGAGGQPLVRHTLKVEFPAGEETHLALTELSETTGFIALITTGAGQRLLAGYSPRFGAKYPLRLTKGFSDSGSRYPDFPSVTVIFESTDTEYSKPLKG